MTERDYGDGRDYPDGSVGRYVRERWGARPPARAPRPYIAPIDPVRPVPRPEAEPEDPYADDESIEIILNYGSEEPAQVPAAPPKALPTPAPQRTSSATANAASSLDRTK